MPCLKIEKVPDFCLGRGAFKAETARQAVACRGFPTQKTHVLDKKTVFAIFQTSPKWYMAKKLPRDAVQGESRELCGAALCLPVFLVEQVQAL